MATVCFRYVLEDMLVKDGPEGKLLQDKLNEEKPEQERLAKKLLKKKKMERSQSDRSGSRLSTDGESVASTGLWPAVCRSAYSSPSAR